jgi:prevent-host-death family protein
MEIVTLHTAKTTLSKLVARVEAGEEIVLARGNTPVARLVPIVQKRKDRVPGRFKGRISLDDSFFDPMTDEELAEWE